jgi:hypothetical protein
VAEVDLVGRRGDRDAREGRRDEDVDAVEDLLGRFPILGQQTRSAASYSASVTVKQRSNFGATLSL